MSHYRNQLYPWCIIRLLPKAQCITVARFRKRNDADAHARTLKRLIPHAHFTVIFEPAHPSSSPTQDHQSDRVPNDSDRSMGPVEP